MRTMEVAVPDCLEYDGNNLRRFLSVKLFESGKLTLGQAAEMSGMSMSGFADILGDYGSSLINYSAADALSDANSL